MLHKEGENNASLFLLLHIAHSIVAYWTKQMIYILRFWSLFCLLKKCHFFGLFCHFNHTHSDFGILLKVSVLGDKSNLTDYVSKSRPIHLERKRKFLKNVHQRLHVNYFGCFLKNLSSVRMYSLFTCPVYDLVTIFACALSVIQFPSLLTNCKQQSQKVVLAS